MRRSLCLIARRRLVDCHDPGGWSERALEDAGKLFSLMPERNAITETTMIQAYGESSRVHVAVGIFNKIPESNLLPWTSMLAAYAQNGQLEEARAVFHNMPEHDLVAFTSMLTVHIQSGDLEQAKAIFARMPDQDIISKTAMIQAFSQNGQLREVGSSSRRCPSRTSSRAQLFSPRMLGAAIWTEQNRCLTRCRSGTPLLDVSRRCLRSEQSLGGAQELARPHASPQLGAHHGQYSQLGRIDEAEVVFDKVVVKDILAWNTMLAAYSQHGYIEELRNTFDAMPERDIVSWNIAVATARARRRSSKALLQRATVGLRFLDDHDRGLCPERVYETLSTPCHRCLPRSSSPARCSLWPRASPTPWSFSTP
ncbi:pentatricopeptide repeat-containing protein At4g02750-like [Selaginella moellendorffii]|uniref:pentatricopeptide repeat-containing protein At4g02750-like n=1 Tax=Selaginella moellendorffii TaxID=88036 RepID=UPI000D1CB8C2|nr:pentatricopeptide repeat-containing protein At4g02750-like [Selaginella moellendorffii]|eukprot:XP_024536038.1 pentatricopeptide repeat-containing protein At4g02750-like [Selaginella moellendorffii]